MRAFIRPSADHLSLDAHCTKCTNNCCKWGPLLILPAELAAIEAMPEMQNDPWHKAALATAKNKIVQHDGYLSLEKQPGESCPFLLSSHRCGIYPLRPTDCKIWPLYYPEPNRESTPTIAPRCPAHEKLKTDFIYTAWTLMKGIPTRLRDEFFKQTIAAHYELTPLTSGHLSFAGNSGRHSYEATAKTWLISFFFAYALVEAFKSFIGISTLSAAYLPRSYATIGLLMFGYFVLNSIRYLDANLELASYVSILDGARTRSLYYINEVLRITECLLFVTIAMWIRIPGARYSEGDWPPIIINPKVFMTHLGSVVQAFFFLNLVLAITDVLWCTVMKQLIFIDSRDGTVGLPNQLAEWTWSGILEIGVFAAALIISTSTIGGHWSQHLNHLAALLIIAYLPLFWEVIAKYNTHSPR